jgi:hypothetical protein
MVRENVAEFLETGSQRLGEAIAEFRTRHGNAPILEMIRLQVARNLKRATTLLR